MRTWRDAPNNEDAVLSQVLYRDDGKPLGMIMRYYEDARTYPGCASVQPGDYFVFDAKRMAEWLRQTG